MRVGFDARVLDDRGLREGGIGRYTSCLLDGLRDSHAEEIAVLGPLRRPPTPRRLREGWEHLLLGRDARRAGADVLHSPAPDLATMRPRVPYVVTIHDVVPLKRPERYLRTGLKFRLRYAAARRAGAVIVPSLSVAEDVERLLQIEPERLHVVHHAPAPGLRPVSDPHAVLRRLELPDRFLLWVGSLDPPDPRKCVPALAEEVSRRAGPPLVLAGRASEAARALAAPGRVQLVGRVSDEELAALYSAAGAVVLPSDDEGYGLPAVEALACGTPVAAFAAGSLAEVLAGVAGAALVEPGDVSALLDAAERLFGRAAESPRRTWNDVARDTWAVYAAAFSNRATSIAVRGRGSQAS